VKVRESVSVRVSVGAMVRVKNRAKNIGTKRMISGFRERIRVIAATITA
jgi:hypothetical protein